MVSGVFSLPLDPYSAAENTAGVTASPRLREFICGAENQLLTVLAQFENPDTARWNLLVLSGPSQSGKTHLAVGLCRRYEQAPGARRAVYITGADFARQYAAAVDTDSVSEFRTRFRRAGLVVIDDLELLAGKTAAQEELAHTLDALESRGARAVITWRGPRFDPSLLEPALASRLRGSLVLPLQLPELAAREEMIRRLASTRGLDLQPLLVAGLAGNSPATFPELVSRLAKVSALGEAPEIIVPEVPRRSVDVKSIVAAVARHFHFRQSDLRGAGRSRSLVFARGVALHLSRTLTGLSLSKIGKEFGNRDHTTVLHACVKLESLLAADAELAAEVAELRAAVEHRSSGARAAPVEKRSTRRRQARAAS